MLRRLDISYGGAVISFGKTTSFMKAFILLGTMLLLSSTSTWSQVPVITANDAPIAGVSYSYSFYEGVYAPLSTGEMQTWDLSDLSISMPASELPFVPPTTTPFSATLTSADVAWQLGGSVFLYYDVLPDGVYESGYEEGPADNMNYSDPRMLYPLPCTFGISFNDAYAWSGISNGSPASQSGQTGDWVVDGWGTLILPSGELMNVLKLHGEENSVSAGTGNIDYHDYFLHPGLRHYVATVDQGVHMVDGNIESSYREVVALSDLTVLVMEAHLGSPLSLIQKEPGLFAWTGNSQLTCLEVIDAIGHIVWRTSTGLEYSGTSFDVDLRDHPPGVYVFRAQGAAGAENIKQLIE